jgi:hypothetical protein
MRRTVYEAARCICGADCVWPTGWHCYMRPRTVYVAPTVYGRTGYEASSVYEMRRALYMRRTVYGAHCI